jgi:hypothetical protein
MSNKEAMMTQQGAQLFSPEQHLVPMEEDQYLPVQWRLVWFHQATGPRAGYITVEVDHDRSAGFARFLTVAWDGNGESWHPLKVQGVELAVCGRVATGEGSESRSQFPDYYEAAATKALGRALAGLGFGTQFATERTAPAVWEAPFAHSTGKPARTKTPVH